MSQMEQLLFIRDFLPGYKQHWTYYEHGCPVMIVARYENGKEKTYRQFHREKGEWIVGTSMQPYPLFGLETLKNISPFDALLIAEGEKCVSVLHQLQWPAISSVLGSNNPSSSDWSSVRYYKRFIILRDNDQAGISFARIVATEIRRILPKSEVFVVNLVETIPGGDIVDCISTTVMLGQSWDGFEQININMIELVRHALTVEINRKMIPIEECIEIDYRSVEMLFSSMPKKFQLELREVPTFPIKRLPKEIGEYLSNVSTQYSQVPDFAATTMIVSLGGLIGRSVHLSMRPGSGWEETANCWSALVGPPSAKKSPIMRKIFNLFKPLEKRAAENFQQEEREYKTKKKKADEDDFDNFPPIRKRYITDDSTIPKLREILAGNPRGIIYRNDELKGQLEKLDKIGNEGDRSFMMSCWSGLEDYSEDRMCRPSQLNIPLALTWIGCIPPSPLHKYLREAMSKGSGADGFMQRFQFVCYPNHAPTFRLPNEEMCSHLEKRMQDLFEQIDKDSMTNRTLSFFKEAQNRFNDWVTQNENNARSGNHPAYWESHLGKQAKVVAVLTIIIHRLKEVFENTKTDKVSLTTLESALEIQQYYLEHAWRCYESVSGGAVSDAEVIIELLRKKRISERFKAQDIYHQGLGGLSDSRRVQAALELLHDYDWVAFEKIKGKMGRSNDYWILHPRAFEKT